MDNCQHKSTCKNYNIRCHQCNAVSDIYNHYPCFEKKKDEQPLKVYIVASDDFDVFQTTINDFIKDKEVIDIKYQSNVAPMKKRNGSLTMVHNDRALIIYKEKNDADRT